MGNFSWDCALCGASMHHAWEGPSDPDAWQEDVLLFAANGVTAEGKYDGYGRIGGFTIPEAWAHDDIAFWTHSIKQREEMDRRDAVVDQLLSEVAAILAKHGEPALIREPRTQTPDPDPIDPHAELAKAMVENIRFTVYHRRCWEAAGRPGFAGQSKCSEDQGR